MNVELLQGRELQIDSIEADDGGEVLGRREADADSPSDSPDIT